jgi:hypothetical protein
MNRLATGTKSSSFAIPTWRLSIARSEPTHCCDLVRLSKRLRKLKNSHRLTPKNPTPWFRFAKLFAIASESLPARKDELAVRAIELLKKAIDHGFNDFT